MKYPHKVLMLIAVCLFALPAYTKQKSVPELLERLDSVLGNEDYYVRAKLDKINHIKNNRRTAVTQEQIYWNNSQLYDEYFVFDADSAMHYAFDNLRIAKSIGNKQWEDEWHIKKSFTLSVTGLINEAMDELQLLNPSELSDANKVSYFGQLAYLHSHMGQLSDHRIIGNEDNDRISHAYEDSILSLINENDPNYLWYAASSETDNAEVSMELISKLKKSLDSGKFNTRTDAMNSYILAQLYGRADDKENQLRYLILSAITDATIANRDIASITELAQILLNDGDIDRAYTYINYSLNQALRLPNRVRAAALATIVTEVHGLHEAKLNSTQHRLTVTLIILSLILILLALLIFMYKRRSRQFHKSRQKLKEANDTLTRHMHEISKSRDEREQLISKLQLANVRNNEISATLREANYVKEECLGATFALCSDNIARFDKYRNDILKLARAQKWKDLQEELLKQFRLNKELKQFYQSFDTLFLNIYPDFVSDFNKLLRPDEQLEVEPGILSTELRIYALVRLGICDSVKIAKLLHCSTQTVYNYRLRMRNKAIIGKENFAEAVKSLGKFKMVNNG